MSHKFISEVNKFYSYPINISVLGLKKFVLLISIKKDFLYVIYYIARFEKILISFLLIIWFLSILLKINQKKHFLFTVFFSIFILVYFFSYNFENYFNMFIIIMVSVILILKWLVSNKHNFVLKGFVSLIISWILLFIYLCKFYYKNYLNLAKHLTYLPLTI